MITAPIHKFTIITAVCFCAIFSAEVNAQSLSEFSNVDSLQVGDIFNYSITLNRSQNYDHITFPDSADFGKNFEVRSRQHFQLTSYKDSISYDLQFFGTADTTISRLPVLLIQGQDTTTLYTNPVPIRFNSVLAQNEQSFRPFKPIFEFAKTWWAYILGGLVLAAAAYYFYQYYRKEQETEERPEPQTFTPTPFVNPLKKLKDSIRDLEQRELRDKEQFKQFYIDLGDAIRRYYEDLYHLPALESTSRELLNMLRKRTADQDLIRDTRAVLQEADIVKFANFTPTAEQANRALEKANNFLQRARKVDGPRVDHLRRKHQSEMEKQRERFKKQQEEVQA